MRRSRICKRAYTNNTQTQTLLLVNKTSYTTPVWWMGVITLLEVIAFLVLWSGVQDLRTKGNDIVNEATVKILMNQLNFLGVTVAILVAELFAYWIIRRFIVRKLLVWGHIIGLLLALVVLPIVSTFFIASLNLDPDIRRAFHWTLLIVGHICFVLVLIDAFKKRKKDQETVASDSPDILNDYADKFS